MSSLQRTAVVTGAGRGIGRAIALELAEQGLRVLVLGRGREALEETRAAAGELASQIIVLPGDINDPDFPERLLSEAPAVDVLVHNAAATAPYAPIEDLDLDDYDRVLETGLRAAWRLSRAVISGMKERSFGRVILIGSMAGSLGGDSQTPYAIAKAGLQGLTKSLALEASSFGVTCNLVEPGLILTERIARAVPQATQDQILERTAARRAGTPEEVASLVAFLSSDRASYITGACIPVSGGLGLGTRTPPSRG